MSIKHTTTCAGLLALLLIGACDADGNFVGAPPADGDAADAGAPSDPTDPNVNTDEDTPRFLTTMSVVGTPTFTALMPHQCSALSFQSASTVTLFTERPTRQATAMSMADFVGAWAAAYGKVGPNAQLQLFNSSGDSQSIIVQLNSVPAWDEASSTVTFSNACFTPINNGAAMRPPSEFSFGSLFIDDAKLFSWNSCYSTSSAPLGILPNGCIEQWGSYPADCGWAFETTAHGRGNRCRDDCDDGTCKSGCFNNYSATESLTYSASFYYCTE